MDNKIKHILITPRGWQIFNWAQLSHSLKRLDIPISVCPFEGSLDSVSQLVCVNLFTDTRCQLSVARALGQRVSDDNRWILSVQNVGESSIVIAGIDEDNSLACMFGVAAALATSKKAELHVDGALQEPAVLRLSALGLLGDSIGVDLRPTEIEPRSYFDPIVWAFWRAFAVIPSTSGLMLLVLLAPPPVSLTILVLIIFTLLLTFAIISVGLVMAAVVTQFMRVLAVWADTRFARSRFRRDQVGPRADPFCLVLRSTQTDAALSLYSTEINAVYDAHPFRLDVRPGFRQLLSERMQPFYSLLIKNDQRIRHGVSLTYSDDEWKDRVVRDMLECKFILFVPMWPSESLEWELAQIAERNLFGKTFLVMPPSELTRPASAGYPDNSQSVRVKFEYLARALVKLLFPVLASRRAGPITRDVGRIKVLAKAWEQTYPMMKNAGMTPPRYAPAGAFILFESIFDRAGPLTPLQTDYYRILQSVGSHDWQSSRGKYLASVARQPSARAVA